MSKIKFQGNASGTGVLTITSPNTNADRTITLPDEDVTLGGGVDGIVSSADATAMTITSDEKIGIGTTTPSAALEVKNTTDGTTFAFQATNDNDHEIVQIGAQSDGDGYLTVHGQGASTNIKVLLHSDAESHISGGDLKIGSGDIYFGTAGKGIVLGATSNVDANTLDDYEEGEFDASYSSSGASFSYTARKGYYTKIGNRVFYNIYMQLDGSQTFTANQVTITGLPFASNGGGHFNSSSICETRYVDFDSGFTALAGRIGANTTSILLLEIGDGQAGSVLRSNQLNSSSGQVFISGSYAI